MAKYKHYKFTPDELKILFSLSCKYSLDWLGIDNHGDFYDTEARTPLSAKSCLRDVLDGIPIEDITDEEKNTLLHITVKILRGY